MANNKKFKKHKAAYIFAPILGLGLIAGTVTPIALAKPNKIVDQDTTPTVELDTSSSAQGVSILSSSVKMHQESTIAFNVPEDKQIGDIEVKVNGNKIESNQYTIDQINKKITIKAEAVTGTKIVVKVTAEEKIEWSSKTVDGVVYTDRALYRNKQSFVNFNVTKDGYEPNKIAGSYINKNGDVVTITEDMYELISNGNNSYTVKFKPDNLFNDAKQVNFSTILIEKLNATLNEEALEEEFSLDTTGLSRYKDKSTIKINIPEGYSITRQTVLIDGVEVSIPFSDNTWTISKDLIKDKVNISINIQFDSILIIDTDQETKDRGVTFEVIDQSRNHAQIKINPGDKKEIKQVIITQDGEPLTNFTIENNIVTVNETLTGTFLILSVKIQDKLTVTTSENITWLESESVISRDPLGKTIIVFKAIDETKVISDINLTLDEALIEGDYWTWGKKEDENKYEIVISPVALQTGSVIHIEAQEQTELKLQLGDGLKDKVRINEGETHIFRDNESVIKLEMTDPEYEIIPEKINVTLDGKTIQSSYSNNTITIPAGELKTGQNIVVNGEVRLCLYVDVPYGASWVLQSADLHRDAESTITIAPTEGWEILNISTISIDGSEVTGFTYDESTRTATIPSDKFATGSKIELGVNVSQIQYQLILNKTSLLLDVGNTETLTAEVSPQPESTPEINWSSNDPGVATVGATTGVINAVSSGTATISATYVSAAGHTALAQCQVTVKDPTTQVAVTFHSNDGTGTTNTQIINKDSKISKPTDPTRTGDVTFVNWYTALPADGLDWQSSNLYNFSSTVSTDLNLYARWSNEFNGIDWSTIITSINNFEAIDEPTIDDAKALCISLGVLEPVVEKDVKTTLQTNLVGKVGSIIINDLSHSIRCVDCMHDPIANSEGKYAALTFELLTNLSKKDASENVQILTTAWNFNSSGGTGYVKDYTNSLLRYNLTGEGEPEYAAAKWTTPAINMIDKKLTSSNAIKTVTKKLSMKLNGSSSWDVKEYSDKLFLPTYRELTVATSTYCKNDEGATYKYYTSHDDNKYRLKYKVSGETTSQDIWISSPTTSSSNNSGWIIVLSWGQTSEKGRLEFNCWSNDVRGYAFAFCI